MSLLAQGQTSATGTPPVSPNDPGILDPVIAELLHDAYRVPGSLQVTGDSELVNLVGKVRRKKAKGARSATGAIIQDERPVTKNVDRALEDMADAAASGQGNAMRAAAQQLQNFLSGASAGYISDGFPLLHHFQGGFAPDHLAGEYRMKRLQRTGLTFLDDQGVTRDYWEVKWRLLWTDAGIESDLALLEIPIEAHPADRVLVHFEIYCSAADECGPMSYLDDSDLVTSDGLPFKGYDATWVRLREDEIHEFEVDHGAIGALRELGIRGWRVKPEPLARVDLVREMVDPRSGSVMRDPRGEALASAARTATRDSISLAAPESKIWQIAEAALQGASTAQVAAAMHQAQTAPRGTWQDWSALLENRRQLPLEALDMLAAEGIQPGANRLAPLGPYDFVAVQMNHEWYGVAAKDVVAPFAAPLAWQEAEQGGRQTLKVINLDQLPTGVQIADYGPALHDDLGTCYYAPHGGKSLEIFSDKPVYGYPKADELQWRTGWGFRPGAGIVGQYDLLPRAADRARTKRFRDSFGTFRQGWQYPASMRGGDFRVDPPLSVLGRTGRPALHGLLESDGSTGLVIGRTTPGYGSAKMPHGDLSGFHPLGLVNTDTDGDQIPDALIFPQWLRNPDAAGGDLVLSTPAWSPFLYLNPNNGTVWNDPARPEQGLWGFTTYGLGAPLAPGSAQRIDWVRPRALGQAVWLNAGALRAHGSLPLTMLY
ncbi:MAG: hypothetical protein CMJ94_10835 [Planctomycetes bacterium]|nr:hypothetical protein [Planctomycetota bacterium]